MAEARSVLREIGERRAADIDAELGTKTLADLTGEAAR